MKAIRKNVGQPAQVIDTDLSYDFWCEVVGGNVQLVPIGPEVEVCCNEEGMWAGEGGRPLPQNCAGYLGNILILAIDSDAGDCRDMTEEEVRKCLRYLEVFKDEQHPVYTGGPVVSILCGEEVEQFMKLKTQGTLAVWESL